jgi:hypothetical protein
MRSAFPPYYFITAVWVWGLAFGAPGFHPADDLCMRHTARAGLRFGERRFDARHLPGTF